MYNLICTMNMPSHHQGDFYRELSKKCDLKVVFKNSITNERKSLGWENDFIGYESYFDFKNVSEKDNCIYFLSGMPGTLKNVKLALSKKILFQSEIPYITNNRIRFLIKNYFFAKLLNLRNIPFLGIGEPVRNYLINLKLRKELIFPFAYFVKKKSEGNINIKNPLIFSGRLIKGKRIDLLLNAFSQVSKCRDKGLIIIGDGPEKNNLIELTDKLGIVEEVKFTGALAMNDIYKYYCNGSSLILPSIHDGWGVVVNEAINVGMPAVISDSCGSKELIENGNVGYIFKTDSIDSLKYYLEKLYSDEDTYKNLSDNCIKYSDKISPESGAEYLIEIIDYIYSNTKNDKTKPNAPWLTQN